MHDDETNVGYIKITNGPTPHGNGGNGQEGAVVYLDHDDMVERVAKAIRLTLGKPGDPSGCDLARAAIEAMREPTVEMQRAGFLALDYTADCNCAQIEAWQAMIDAALQKDASNAR